MNSICKVVTSEKRIAISFDDGPSEYTPQILDILKEHNVQAIFFVVGRKIKGNESLLKRMHDEGHIIGNHSFSHHFWFDLFSTKKMFIELQKTENAIKDVISQKVNFFRPPYGVTNPMLAKAVAKKEYLSIGWSLKVYEKLVNNKMESHIKRELKFGDIILFHDTQKNTADILKHFIETTNKNTYSIFRLDKLLNKAAYENSK